MNLDVVGLKIADVIGVDPRLSALYKLTHWNYKRAEGANLFLDYKLAMSLHEYIGE
jgi:hypothetical protein